MKKRRRYLKRGDTICLKNGDIYTVNHFNRVTNELTIIIEGEYRKFQLNEIYGGML